MKARTVIPILAMPAAPAQPATRLAAVGRWLRDHATLVRRLQWGVVLVYAALLDRVVTSKISQLNFSA